VISRNIKMPMEQLNDYRGKDIGNMWTTYLNLETQRRMRGIDVVPLLVDHI
jgi:hypothetical protein